MQIKEYIKRVTVYAMGIVLIILMTLAFAYIWYNVYNIRIKREFDSCIIKKVLAGRIKPAFFVSNF